MRLRDLRTAWRSLLQEPENSAVSIFGLAFCFAAFFLLESYVLYSFRYEKDIPGNEHVYVIKNRFNLSPEPGWTELTPLAFKDAITHSGLDLAVTAVIPNPRSMRVGDRLYEVTLTSVDPDFQKIFGIKPVEGNLQEALTRPDALALTKTTAEKLFGQPHAVGKVLRIAGKPLRVAAVLADPPDATTLHYAALTGLDTSTRRLECRLPDYSHWKDYVGFIYVKLAPGVSPSDLERAVQDAASQPPFTFQFSPETLRKLGENRVMDIRAGRFSDAYFDRDVSNAIGSGQRGDKRIAYGLAAIGLMILLIGTANYINLAAARTVRRYREIGIHRLLGGSPRHIAVKLLTESLMVSLLAATAGMLLAWLLLPLYSELVKHDLESALTPASLAAGIATGGAIGLLAGAYPVLIALRVNAAHALSGRLDAFASAGGLWLQRILVVLQFAIAMMLTSFTATVSWQTNRVEKAAPGFDASSLFVADLPTDVFSPAADAFQKDLARLPEVSGVTATSNAAGRDRWAVSGLFNRPGQDMKPLGINRVGASFFNVYRMQPLAGRFFSPEEGKTDNSIATVIDTNALTALGFASPAAALDQTLTYSNEGSARLLKVIGVAPPIRYHSAREVPQPMIFLLASGQDGWKMRPSIFSIRTQGNPADAMRAVERAWLKQFPDDVPQIKPASSFFTQNYEADADLARILAAASGIAILISAFGIYALSSHSTQRRTREIILRKLYGAGAGDIVRLLGREFVILIPAGAALGLPIAAALSGHYLSGFVERFPAGYRGTLIALALAGVIALAASLHHILSAARIIPSIAYLGRRPK